MSQLLLISISAKNPLMQHCIKEHVRAVITRSDERYNIIMSGSHVVVHESDTEVHSCTEVTVCAAGVCSLFIQGCTSKELRSITKSASPGGSHR